MATTNAASESISFSTPAAQPTLALIVGETPSSVLVSMLRPLEDSGEMEQLTASNLSCQRTNQALIGTNVSTLLMAVLFFTYRYFKKSKSRTKKPKAGGFDGYDSIHKARVGLHDVARTSKETFTPVSAIHSPPRGFHLPSRRPSIFSKPWLCHTRGGHQSQEGAAEEGRLSPSPNKLPDPISSNRDRFLEQGRDAFGIVPMRIKASDQRNIGSAEARPPSSQEGKPKNSTPLVTDKALGNRDRRSPDRTPPISNSRETIARRATATTSSRAHRHRGLRKPFPVAPASARMGSRMVPPSSFPAFDTQRPRDRISRSTTASSDMGSIPSLPSYQHYSDNADGSTSPTPSSPSAYGHGRLRESTPPMPVLPETVGGVTPTPLGRNSKSNDTSVEGQQRAGSSRAASTMHSTLSDVSSTPPHLSYRQSVEHGRSMAPIPSSPPLLDGYDWLRASRAFSLLGLIDLVAAPPPGEGDRLRQ
ncbi:hypothetical protein AB1N83_011340 [Pleurotus pulmonarius]